MAAKKRILVSPPPRTTLLPSPTPSTFRTTPLASGSLASYPVTASPFSSLPTFSFTQAASSPSPDLFDTFEYSEDMDDDLRRIDLAAEAEHYSRGHPLHPPNNRLPSDSPPPTPPQDEKTWVVFRSKTPGIYNNCLSAAMQTQGYSDAFQRVFPDRDSADAAWAAFLRDRTYPDYGRGPWVVFLGRKPGVFTKITELECSVKGHPNAIFQSCSSVAEGNIKYQLFVEKVVRMFADPDLFSGVDGLMPQLEGGDDSRGAKSAIRSIAPVPEVQKHFPPPLAPQTAESSKSAGKRNASGSLPASPQRKFKLSRPGDGWYIAHNAVLPGVYYGANALRNARPIPGGFQCAPDKQSADDLFHDLTMNGAVVWADV